MSTKNETGKPPAPFKPALPAEADKPGETTSGPEGAGEARAGRRYSVGTTTVKGRRKVRYVETSDPKKGCRFL
ncbi:MAG TPA: hypothetical protein GX696_05145 [Pseudomonadaceae bacterium]|nr:hypothetical protein [Pseudomonadaceae bacterium]